MAIRWVFFDVGSTLVDEEAAFKWRYEELREQIKASMGWELSYGEFDERMHEAGKVSDPPISHVLKDLGVNRRIKYRVELERPYPGAAELLEKLKQAGYHLGIIANQGVGLRERLERYGLTTHLDAVFGSDDLQLWKPDVAFYKYALEQTGCLPEEAVMVGDRVDNDVAPAHKVGMRAVRILNNSYFDRRKPSCPEEIPEATVETLAQLPDVFAKLG